MGKAKAIFLLGSSGLLAALAIIIVAVNAAKESWTVWVIFTEVAMNPGTVLIYGAVVGGLLWMIWRAAVPAGIRAVRELRKAERAKVTQERLQRLETGEPAESAAPAASEETEPESP